MASPNLYVRSTDGVDTNNGTAWTGTSPIGAKETIAGAAAIDSTTDKRIWVSDNHAESKAAAQTWAFAGTQANPIWVVCVDDTSNPDPPIATATTATCTTTGANGYLVTGNVYVRGLTINCGSGAVNADIALANGGGEIQVFEDCNFNLVATGGACSINIGSTSNAQAGLVIWENVSVKFGASTHRVEMNLGSLIWDGGSVVAGSSAATTGLIGGNSAGEHMTVRISGVDLTNVSVTGFLIGKNSLSRQDIVFRNCKVPAWTTGGLYTGTLEAGDRIEMYNCDSADTNYRLWIADYLGEIRDNNTIYKIGGTNDGATSLSWKLVSVADAEYPHQTLNSPEIVSWNDIVGVPRTVSVDIATAATTLKNDEIWLEVQYMGEASSPLGYFISDAKADVLATAADQDSSSATWSGIASPVTQKLSVTFTPQKRGFIHAVVKLAKPSTTVYVDPKLNVS